MVGIGPGGPLDRTLRAEKAIGQSTIIVGYARYLELIKDLIPGKEIISSGMRQEKERCLMALQTGSGGRYRFPDLLRGSRYLRHGRSGPGTVGSGRN